MVHSRFRCCHYINHSNIILYNWSAIYIDLYISLHYYTNHPPSPHSSGIQIHNYIISTWTLVKTCWETPLQKPHGFNLSSTAYQLLKSQHQPPDISPPPLQPRDQLSSKRRMDLVSPDRTLDQRNLEVPVWLRLEVHITPYDHSYSLLAKKYTQLTSARWWANGTSQMFSRREWSCQWHPTSIHTESNQFIVWETTWMDWSLLEVSSLAA